jgi:hypothetical protein
VAPHLPLQAARRVQDQDGATCKMCVQN